MRITSRPRRRRATVLLNATLITLATLLLPASAAHAGPVPSSAGTVVDKAPGVERVIVYHGDADAFLRGLGRISDFDLVYRYEIIRGAAVAVPTGRVDAVIAYARSVGMKAERDMEIHADLTNSARTVHVKANGQDPGAWSLFSQPGAGVTIAVIDSGIYALHSGLDDLDDNPGTTDPKVVKFKDYVNNGGGGAEVAPYDDNDHGSHVSGIAAGTGGGSTGDGPNGKNHVGMAYRANLAGFKVFNSAGSGSSTSFIAALNWIVQNPNAVTPRIRVVNYSGGSTPVGGNNNGNSAQSAAIDTASAAGILTVAAGGNGDSDGLLPNQTSGNLNIPADARTAIAVCSSNSANPPTAPTYSDWDSEGPTGDGRIKPDVCAPGELVQSVNSPAGTNGGPNAYIGFGGTSMSSPHVAGIAALIIQAVPSISPAQVREVLYETARERVSGPEPNGKNNDRGFGEVNAKAAIELAINRYGGNLPLSVGAGGPYSVIQNETRTLSATATRGSPPYTFAWDLDNDTQFDDATGPTVTFSNTSTTGDKIVSVRVTDSASPTPATATASATVTVLASVNVFTDDVETGDNGWVPNSPTGWHRTTIRSNSPSTSWYAGNDAAEQYAPLQDSTLTRTFNFSTGPAATSGQLLLGFARSGDLEPTFDFLRVKIRRVGDPFFVTLGEFDDELGTSWVTNTFDITSYKGFQTEVQFQFTSDELIQLSGPFIDDIRIIGTVPPPGDFVAPGQITDLVAGGSAKTSMPLAWTATGDDGAAGTATSYDLRYATVPITAANFGLALPVGGVPAPLPAGSSQLMTVTGLTPNTTYYFAIKAVDEASNFGLISNIVSATTLPDVTPPTIGAWPESRGNVARTGTIAGRGSIGAANLLSSVTMPGPVDASPLIVDLNGDGKLDVLAVSDATAIAPITVRAHRWAGSGLETLWTYTVPVLSGQNEGFANLAVGQLNNAGPLEVVVYSNNRINTQAATSNQGRLAVLNAQTGVLIDDLSVDTTNPEAVVIGVDGAPAIGDVTGDGVPEIVFIHHVGGTAPGSFLTGLNLQGGVLVERFDNNLTSTSNWTTWALAELRGGHPGLEVVVGQAGVFVNGPSTGAVRLCLPTTGGAGCGESIATTVGVMGLSVADLDGNGQPEIVANGRTRESLNVIKTLPSPGLVARADGFLWNTASLADIDGIPGAEIVNVAYSGSSTFPESDPSNAGNITIRGFDGTSIVDKGNLARPPTPGSSTMSKGGGTLVDIAGDARPELVFGSGHGYLVAYSLTLPTPTLLWSQSIGSNPAAPVAAGDINGDGLLDLVGGSASGQVFVVGAGPAAQLRVTPSVAYVNAGQQQAFTAWTLDAVGNPLADVTANTSFRLIPSTGTCVQNRCSATTPGHYTVRATHSGFVGNASLNVSP